MQCYKLYALHITSCYRPVTVYTCIVQRYPVTSACHISCIAQDIFYGSLDPVIANTEAIEFDEFEWDSSSMRRTDLPGGVVYWQDYHIMKRRGISVRWGRYVAYRRYNAVHPLSVRIGVHV